MERWAARLHAIAYCVSCAAIWLVIGGIAGALIGAGLIQEEARGPVSGVMLGAPAGALLGLILGWFAVRRRARRAARVGSSK
jgi:hypothetical protein